MYVQDYDENFPYAWGLEKTWNQTIEPYVNNGKPVNDNFSDYTGMWHCPSDSVGKPLSYALNAQLAGGGAFPAKSLSAMARPADTVWAGETNKVWASWNNGSGGFGDPGTDFTRVQPGGDYDADESSQKAIDFYNNWSKFQDFSDGTPGVNPTDCVWATGGPGGNTGGAWQCKYPAFRHQRTGKKSGNANFVFGDGHAKNVRWGQMGAQNWLPLIP